MSAAQLLNKAEAMGVTVRLDGDVLKIGGPKPARAVIIPELAAHKSEIMAHLRAAADDAPDCTGALMSRSGGLYLPWGPRLSPEDVRQLRAELVELIEDMADAEDWAESYRDEVLARAVRGPLSDLLPNLHYFRKRVAEFYAECEARRISRSKQWRANDDLRNRGY